MQASGPPCLMDHLFNSVTCKVCNFHFPLQFLVNCLITVYIAVTVAALMSAHATVDIKD